MSEQSPYQQLGVSEGSSFDEIQAARNRLCTEFQGNEEQLQKIEMAYDSVLMDRLKMRQEGRIKVPDGIRFAERQVEAPAKAPLSSAMQPPSWLEQVLDTPSRTDIWLSAGVMTALTALAVFVAGVVQLVLILGTGATFYFIYRKEQKLGRAVLWSALGLIGGLVVGGVLFNALSSLVPEFTLAIDVVATVFTCIVFWLISSFLR